MYQPKIKVFYTPKMVVKQKIGISNCIRKSQIFMQFLEKEGLLERHFTVEGDFAPLSKEDLLLCHRSDYINEFYSGELKNIGTSTLKWSKDYANTLLYCESSIYHAIKHAIEDPSQICHSPVNNFNKAMPWCGIGASAFALHTVASLKIFQEYGLSGCYLDLDFSYGAAIESARDYYPLINQSIPKGFNHNPDVEYPGDYGNILKKYLETTLEPAIMENKIHYIVWAHSASTHVSDDFGELLTTEQWLDCSTLFYSWVKKVSERRGKPVPIVTLMSGGNRSDDINSVLGLHSKDLTLGIDILTMSKTGYNPVVKPRIKKYYITF